MHAKCLWDNKRMNTSIEDIQYIIQENIKTDIGVGQTNEEKKRKAKTIVAKVQCDAKMKKDC